MKKFSLITWITIATLFFCIVIALDVSPYLRGPAYYPPEWRWAYFFVNTLSRVYIPLLVILASLGFYYFCERQNLFKKKPLWIFFLASIFLFFAFQFSVLFFSRSGVAVLVHRIINPELNGYFTAALTIHSVPDFLRAYNTGMLSFVYHAKAHPPGAILLFYYLHQLAALFPQLSEWAARQTTNRADVRLLWETLSASAKATVFVSAIFIPLLSTLSIIPLYYTARLLYGAKAATRSIFFFMFIPSLAFFIPINDAFLHVFSSTAFCFFVYGLQKKKVWALFLSGVVLFLGIFFNLSLLPLAILFFIYFLLVQFPYIKKQLKGVFQNGFIFLLGLIVPILCLFVFFGFNFLQVTMTIMQHVPDVHTRSYTIWIFYNLYDFFIFVGIPVAILYFTAFKTALVTLRKKQWKQLDPLVVAFTVMLLIVNFSGSIRGETSRIWIPYVPFIVLIVSSFLTNTLKLSRKTFILLLGLQALQLLVMQEFWVMLW